MAKQSNKPRGIIIVDACMLIHMEKHGVNFPPIFQKLSNEGWKIVIPEMIAVEAGRILANGSNVQSVFSNDKYPHPNIGLFLLAVTKSLYRYPNIQIESVSGHAQADEYCNALRLAMGMQEKFRVGAIKSADNLKYTGIGDDAIVSLVEKSATDPLVPIFVATNDRGLAKRVEFLSTREKLNVVSLDTECFYKSLRSAGADKALKLVIPNPATASTNLLFTETLRRMPCVAESKGKNAAVSNGGTDLVTHVATVGTADNGGDLSAASAVDTTKTNKRKSFEDRFGSRGFEFLSRRAGTSTDAVGVGGVA